MKKIIKLLLVLTSVSLAGCYKTKTEKQVQFKMEPEDKKTLMQQCEEMKSYGNIMQLLAEIKADKDEVLKLLEAEDMREHSEKISGLASDIHEKSEAIIALSKGEWVDPKWEFEVNWVIDNDDFKDVLGSHLKKTFEIKDTLIQKIFFNGQLRSDLMKNISLVEARNKVIVNYRNRGSSLELCQLHKTLMVLVNVKYRNITNRNNRYFNLTLNY